MVSYLKYCSVFCFIILTFAQVGLANDYYPLIEGTSWKFKDSNNKLIIKKVIKEEKIGYYPSVLIEVSDDKSLISTEHVGVTSEGVFRYALDGRRYDQGILLLKNKIKSGDQWSINLVPSGSKIGTEIKVSEEEISVPLGKFKCFVTTISGKDEKGIVFQLKNYFAEKVGVVKVTIEKDGKSFYDLQLVEYLSSGNK